MNRNVKDLISAAQEFVDHVAALIYADPPKVMSGLIKINKYLSRPTFRGVYDPEENIICLDLNFASDPETAERVLRHEIAEWLCCVIRGTVVSRAVVPHSGDQLFRRVSNAVRRYWPKSPDKLANYIQKVISQ